jgi:hypothetical protein
LLDLDSLASFELNVPIADVSEWGVKGLMASALVVEYIFTNHFPIMELKDSLTEYGIGMKQAIQNESIED